MANECKKFPRALFEIFTFFTFMRYRSLNFPIFWTSNLDLLVTFKRIKLEMPDWSHFEEFLKLFQTVTNFLWICQKMTELWPVKHKQNHGDLDQFSHHLFHYDFDFRCLLGSLYMLRSCFMFVSLSVGLSVCQLVLVFVTQCLDFGLNARYWASGLIFWS